MGDIFGRNPVMEALKTNRTINKIWVVKGEQKGSIREIVALAKEKRIMVQQVDRSKLDAMFPKQNHQGVAASVASADYVDWQDIVDIARKKGEDPLIVILDELEDPHNLGAILRSVDAVGAHGVIIPKRRAVPLTDGVAKASAGAIEHVPVARVSNIVQVIEELKKQGIWVAGANMHGQYMHKQDLTGPLAIVIGSEGKGLGKLVSESCDYIVSIPMQGKINSLNASVAAGVLLYEAYRQRNAGK
ncbi:MAG: 23S rRNA (guanosine(2251)-2'-O)-methyltransferase RlmB [Peptococcaceae bacterium]|jgi:23S rRNA (guanosine2251-2'-O)-methyltransferase|nr:23S rRNA (guanosine(2251)-2'-O)-methyltransferase RlmB [Peptococcaceae bacterium]MBQ2370004.1 23S rRNA (guanosine(2251)-2'-O)-methyltransferase RlmB [Peptococcaceae bacterium]MBQ2432294.1 23S rRNA (guanosine(2251)-2'-O)-methyltransferase RlmB [Peptococcaceae bacterium]MBQ2859878.1 23S rRNA (guanosine(2251)-2'-O)-methyltransferase RlmB [Peptococcaceae bacterium]MBQ5369538.1 23S rRNA (guanosine(2251)-2'-O)-methyltransferase RlmB [Peptococcaceae bacterium]